ncbi:hypothetical protein [Pontibacter beigongshangensis]|uniref:hypothetical protein n=1 Tax=Pontibacter beigongshangensis TaxID=2574733 RepID=UPI001650614C|nr:hypothetical protein [Pontibacter beigongshangensis]
MVNRILSYLYQFRGDGQFHDLMPLINKHRSDLSEVEVDDMALEGLIEVHHESAFERPHGSDDPDPFLARITDKGIFFLEGDQKFLAIIEAIEHQRLLHFAYTHTDGRHEDIMLAPYVYGRDPEDRPVVWGVLQGTDHRHHRFLLDHAIIADSPLDTFVVDREMMLSQPRDIEVIARVQYSAVNP